MLDKGLINVLAEILDQPVDDISKYFTSNNPKINNSKASAPETKFSVKTETSRTTSRDEFEKIITEIQKTLKEDAHQRHALELQLKAINERIDKLERKNSTPNTCEIEDVKDFLSYLREDLIKEKNGFLIKRTFPPRIFPNSINAVFNLN